MTDPTSLPSFGALPGAGQPGEPGQPGEHGQPGDHGLPPEQLALRGRVFDTLLQEGFRPGIDEDGDVAFRAQGQLLFVRCLPTAPPLVRVFGQWIEPDVPGGELTRLRAANAIVGRFNLIKATVVDDRLVVAVDLVVSDGIDLTSLLAATIEAVLQSVRDWYAAVAEYGAGATKPV